MTRTTDLKDGEPCSHRGCLNHITHPCEGCGRIGGARVKERPSVLGVCKNCSPVFELSDPRINSDKDCPNCKCGKVEDLEGYYTFYCGCDSKWSWVQFSRHHVYVADRTCKKCGYFPWTIKED